MIALAVLAGCAEGPPGAASQADAGHHADAKLEAADLFWDEVALCGTEVEGYDDITQAADAADAVVVGRISGVSLGNNKLFSEEDYYAEVNFSIEVDETLRNEVVPGLKVSSILIQATQENTDAIIDAMQAHLPEDKVLLVLRKRMDIAETPELYVPQPAMMGLWTRTTRSAMDNPIAADRCFDHYGPELNAKYLKGVKTLDQLVALLRK
jgi:hypothetical protein